MYRISETFVYRTVVSETVVYRISETFVYTFVYKRGVTVV